MKNLPHVLSGHSSVDNMEDFPYKWKNAYLEK